jgi:hypothetical protein
MMKKRSSLSWLQHRQYTKAALCKERGKSMYTVIRSYSGPGAKELIDVLEQRKSEVESLIRGVKGNVGYSLIRSDDGGCTVTVCQDKAGTDESVKLAAEWVKANTSTGAKAPEVSEGSTILHW